MKNILAIKPLVSFLVKRCMVVALLLSLSTTEILAQNNSKNITISVSNQTIESVLNIIRNEYSYSFILSNEDLDTQQRVSLKVSNQPISEVLSQLLAGQDVDFSVKEKTIHISKKKSEAPVKRTSQILRGLVVDNTGEPIIGAAVVINGNEAIGAVTSIDGEFQLSPVVEGCSLNVASLGYASKDVKVGSQTYIKIILESEVMKVDEVVVVGYGTQKKVNLTGAVDQVGAEALENRAAGNITQLLQGAIPNLNITLADGKPNRSASYNVRGTTSIGAGGSALILIDGVEGDPAMINPNDVESVSVLKDASSAAIYGSRAAYGVVLITTKSPEGKKGDKFTINYSGNYAIQSPTAVPDVVDDGYVYASLFKDAWYNYRFSDPTMMNNTQAFSQAWLDEFYDRKMAGNTAEVAIGNDGKYIYYGNEDYFDAIYKDITVAQTHNISMSGSSEKISFYLSGRLYDYDGLYNFKPDTYRTMNIRSKITAQMTPWLKISNNTNYTHDSYVIPMGSAEEGGGVLSRSINDQGHPSSPIFNPDGTLTYSAARAIGGLVTGENYKNRLTKTLTNTTSAEIKIIEDKLKLMSDFSFRTKDYTELEKKTAIPYSVYEGKTQYLGAPETDDYIKESLQLTTYISTNAYMQFEDLYNDVHSVKATLGYNYEQQDYKSTYSKRNGLLMPDLDNLNFAMGDVMSITAGGSRWRYAGTFFRLNYGYDDRYLLEVNGRYDGSSKFPNNSQWGFFPSASAAWRVSQEKFWNVDPKAVSDVKVRASYGSLGNSNVSPYSYLEKFSLYTFATGGNSSTNRYLDGSSALRYTTAPGQIPDNITWESSTTLDFGLDATFLNGRLNLSTDYYERQTNNMYTVGPTLPNTYGATSPKGNYAEMTTRGYEISLSYADSFKLAGKPFNYSMKASLADYTSTIDSYNNANKKLSDYYEGQTIGEIWGFVCNGLFQTQEEIDAAFGGAGYTNSIMQTSEGYVTYPGDMRIEDINKNNKIDRGSGTVDDPGDKKIIGNSKPRYIFSYTFNADWNNFNFSATFDGVGKQDWFPSDESLFWGQYNRPYNQVPNWHIGNYWTEDNPNAYMPRYVGYYGPFNAGTVNVNSRYLQSVAYIRLKNLQLGYNLPKDIVRKISLSNVNFYVSCENIWNWSPLYNITRDFDVVNAFHSSDSDISGSRGDGHNYPTMKSVSFGVSITY